MKKKYLAGLAVAGLVALGLSGPANASLVPVGTGTMQGVEGSYQLIYDTDKNITWLDYSAPANTWQNQVNWASSLSVNFNGQNITGWRLPATVDGPLVLGNDGTATVGYNIATSEMGHLYYTELGLKGYEDINGNYQPGSGWNNKTGPFANLLFGWYWSGTECASGQGTTAWTFSSDGYQTVIGKAGSIYALVVLPGNIAAPVPEPASMLLIGSGLAGLVGLRRKK